MSQCVSIDGHLGTVTLKNYTFLGDPLVHPAWNVTGHVYAGLPGFGPDPVPAGTKEGDGGAIMLLDDRSKGVSYDDRGYAIGPFQVDGMTMITDSGETALIRLQACRSIRFGPSAFNFRATALKGYFCLLQDSASENGTLTIDAAGVVPNDLYTYGLAISNAGWNPASIPGSANHTLSAEEFRIRYKDAKISNNPLFPAGLAATTFDDLQYGKTFSTLR